MWLRAAALDMAGPPVASLAAVEAACEGAVPLRAGREKPFGVRAEVLGKPNPEFARLIAARHGVDLARSLMVGDRLETDVLLGQRAGMRQGLRGRWGRSRRRRGRCRRPGCSLRRQVPRPARRRRTP